jgi:hypothetical protein
MNHRDDDGDDKATSADAEPSYYRRAARHDDVMSRSMMFSLRCEDTYVDSVGCRVPKT